MKQPIKKYFKPQNIQLLIGISVLISLLTANILWFSQDNSMISRGPSDMPPQTEIFQSLLYTPDISTYIVEDDNWDSWGNSGGSRISISSDSPLISNFPITAIQTGSDSEYYPRFKANDISDLELTESPEGMTLTDGSIQWMPGEHQIGTFPVSLRIETDSTTYEVDYTLQVTKEFYPLGTNQRGNSLSGLLIAGSKWTLIPGMIAASIAISFGLLMGVFSNYYGSHVASMFDGFSDLIESIPALIIIFIIAVASQFNMYLIMAGVGLILIPKVYAVIKSTVNQFVENQFVESALEIGFEKKVVYWREIVWYNCKSDMISLTTYYITFSILIEITISYLNLGVQDPDISWGLILLEGRDSILSGEYWMVVFPAILISISILGLTLLGSGAKQFLDPKFK